MLVFKCLSYWLHMASPAVWHQVSPCFPLKRTYVIAFRAHLDHTGLFLQSRSLITFAKIPYPCFCSRKITFIGLGSRIWVSCGRPVFWPFTVVGRLLSYWRSYNLYCTRKCNTARTSQYSAASTFLQSCFLNVYSDGLMGQMSAGIFFRKCLNIILAFHPIFSLTLPINPGLFS